MAEVLAEVLAPFVVVAGAVARVFLQLVLQSVESMLLWPVEVVQQAQA